MNIFYAIYCANYDCYHALIGMDYYVPESYLKDRLFIH